MGGRSSKWSMPGRRACRCQKQTSCRLTPSGTITTLPGGQSPPCFTKYAQNRRAKISSHARFTRFRQMTLLMLLFATTARFMATCPLCIPNRNVEKAIMDRPPLSLDDLKGLIQRLSATLQTTANTDAFHEDIAVPVHIKHLAEGIKEACTSYLAKRIEGGA